MKDDTLWLPMIEGKGRKEKKKENTSILGQKV